MDVATPLFLRLPVSLPAALTLAGLSAMINSVKLIGTAENRMLALYREIEDDREASVRAMRG